MKTCVHLWYLAEFLLQLEVFQTNIVDKIKTHVLYSVSFFPKTVSLWDNVEKYVIATQATDDNT